MNADKILNSFTRTSALRRSTRMELIKVYSTLAATIGSSLAGCYSAARLPLLDPTSLAHTLLLLGLTLSLYLLPARSNNLSLRTTLLLSLSWLIGGTIEPLISALMYRGHGDVLIWAGALTLLMFAGFSAGVMAAERTKVVYFVGAATTALGVLSWVALLGVYYPAFVNLALVLGLAAGCVNLVVQTDEMVVRAAAGIPVDSVTTALGFFTSLVTIFVRLAVILSREKQRESSRSREQKRKSGRRNGATWQGSSRSFGFGSQ
ncbi:Inhibitor of apoptosis-promoting Bax1-related protein, partial [Coemansia sp. RSA 2603]